MVLKVLKRVLKVLKVLNVPKSLLATEGTKANDGKGFSVKSNLT